MKQLSKLKLNWLSNAELNEKELSRILGGGTPGDCCCGCNGPSSSSDNSSANNASDLHSQGCGSGSGSGGITINMHYDECHASNCHTNC